MNTRYVTIDRWTFADGPRFGVLRIKKCECPGIPAIAEPHRWYWTVEDARAEIRRMRAIDRKRAAIGSDKA